MKTEKPEIKVGDFLIPDQWRCGENLRESDGYKDDSFPGCEFRLPAGYEKPDGTKHLSLAVNVKVTGRRPLFSFGREVWRVKIEFVGDGAESQFSGGEIVLKERE